MMPRVEAGDHTSEYEPKAFESLMQLSQLAVAGVHLCSPSLFDKKEAVREGGSASGGSIRVRLRVVCWSVESLETGEHGRTDVNLGRFVEPNTIRDRCSPPCRPPAQDARGRQDRRRAAK